MTLVCTCTRCGHQTDVTTDPALTVPCPHCHAPASTPCKRPSEHPLFGHTVHAQRDLAAATAGAYPLCDCPPPRGTGPQQPTQSTLFEALA